MAKTLKKKAKRLLAYVPEGVCIRELYLKEVCING